MLSFVSALIQVNQDLQTIGALAGLFAVPGLAVLSVLYFGQAREVRRLRDWAGRAPERAAELEQRVSAEAARRVQGPPVAATKPATPAAQAAATKPPPTPVGNGVASQPAAQPATVAAQAATAGAAATPAEAKPGEGEKGAEDGAAQKAQEGEAAKPAEGATEEKKADDSAPEDKKADEPKAAEAAGPTTAPPAPPAPGPGQPPKAPAPSTAAATTAAAAAAAARPRTPAPPVPPRPAAQPLRASAPSATIPPRGGERRPGGAGPATGDGGERRIGRGTLIAAGAAILVLGITVAIVLKVTGGSSKPAPAPNTVAQSPAGKTPSSGTNAPPPQATRAQRAQTNVAILNGTTVTGLARSVANRLQDQGYTIGNVTDASNQAQPVTKVEYGQGHADEARAVATAIKLPASRIVTLSPVDGTTAGPNAEVVVIVGQDAAR